jgi:SAM-dependent methyltransferase
MGKRYYNKNIMDNMNNQRAINCEIVDGNITDSITFASILKKDWEERARKDPSLYVMAESNSTEERILESGKTDFENEFLPRLKEYINGNSTILEIGCGVGRMSYYIAQNCEELTILDISRELLNKAVMRLVEKYNFKNISIVEGNGIDLHQLPDNFYDIVFEYIVFQHIPSEDIVKNYIREINRVLKVGGVALLHGRDVQGIHTDDNFSGNTWHGAQFGYKEIRDYIQDTSLQIIKEEGVGTERYWVLLEKK